ncbi:MAG: hypothetical protein ACM3O3_07425 [Syntrophothermus sp.]
MYYKVSSTDQEALNDIGIDCEGLGIVSTDFEMVLVETLKEAELFKIVADTSKTYETNITVSKKAYYEFNNGKCKQIECNEEYHMPLTLVK